MSSSNVAPPSYNSLINKNSIETHIDDFQNTIYNKELVIFETYIEHKYKKAAIAKPSFIFIHNVIDPMTKLIKKKFNKTITTKEKKDLVHLQKNKEVLIDLDIHIIIISYQRSEINIKIRTLTLKRRLLRSKIETNITELNNKLKQLDSNSGKPTLRKKYKNKHIELKTQHDDIEQELMTLSRLDSIYKRKLDEIYNQLTKILKTGALLLTPEGHHHLDDTNFIGPTVHLFHNHNDNSTESLYRGLLSRKDMRKDNALKTFYTEKPPTYKQSQRNTKLEKKMFTKWKHNIDKKYQTANEGSSNTSGDYLTAEDTLFTEIKPQKRKYHKKKTHKIKRVSSKAGRDPITEEKKKTKKNISKVKKRETFKTKYNSRPLGKRPVYYDSN